MIAAAKKQVESVPQPVTRVARRAKTNPIALTLLVVILASTAAFSYTAVCAMATSKGYSRSSMLAEYQQLQTQNQLLAAEVQQLESSQRLAVSAQNNGMEMGGQIQCLGENPAYGKLQGKIASNLQVNP